MTLDEAIMHCEEVADRCSVTDGNRTCESDHRQLAEWLRELKKYRQENDWTPCGKKKPKVGIDVLIRFEHNDAVGFYSNGSWNINSGNGYYTGLTASEDQPIEWKYYKGEKE